MLKASERLRELKFGTTADDGEIGMMGHESLLVLRDALPLIADVVEAAETGRDRSLLIEHHVSTIEKVAWRVEDAQALNAALNALRDGLEEDHL